MPLKNINDANPQDNHDNTDALQRTKQDRTQEIDRAPVNGDPGKEYWQYANGGTSLKHWRRHPISGVWYSATYS